MINLLIVGSLSLHTRMFKRNLIFVLLIFSFIPLINSSFPISDACAVPRDPGYSQEGAGAAGCEWEDDGSLTCCWYEPTGGAFTFQKYCQTCTRTGAGEDCEPKVPQMTAPPTQKDAVPPRDGVLEEPNTKSPIGETRAPIQDRGNVLEQPEQSFSSENDDTSLSMDDRALEQSQNNQ